MPTLDRFSTTDDVIAALAQRDVTDTELLAAPVSSLVSACVASDERRTETLDAQRRIRVAAAGRDLTRAQARDHEQLGAERSAASAIAERLVPLIEHRNQAAQAEIERAPATPGDPAAGPFHSGAARRGGGLDPAARVLAPEQRITDWTARNARQHRPEHRDLSLGAMLRGWVTGQWDGAEHEQRALLEGTQAGGGVLVPEPL